MCNPSRVKTYTASAEETAHRGGEGYKSLEPETEEEVHSSRLFVVLGPLETIRLNTTAQIAKRIKDFTTEGSRPNVFADQDLVESCQSRSSPDSPEGPESTHQQVRSIGDTPFISRPVKLFIHRFIVSAGSDLVSIVLSASTTISCDGSSSADKVHRLQLSTGTSEKGSSFHPFVFSRFAVNGVGGFARWVHVEPEAPSVDDTRGSHCRPSRSPRPVRYISLNIPDCNRSGNRTAKLIPIPFCSRDLPESYLLLFFSLTFFLHPCGVQPFEILREIAVNIYRVLRVDSPTHYRFDIRIFRSVKSNGTRSATAERAAGAASRELRITCVAFGIRNHPCGWIAERHGAYRPALPAFGAVEEPEDLPFYRLPFCRGREPPRHLAR
ncbi:hypothetical protein GEV33_004492 [Tenebrio molitor]|uniref:Uncharacterized protein n=1 Tax=Tenebrio molitor TaxID=7067 RepID=A0A8J6HPC4_TENMO|nr:hypothetical protein GEV33_004492 [Tenebrio molitor]